MKHWMTIALPLLLFSVFLCFTLQGAKGFNSASGLIPEMVLIPSGEFMMGGNEWSENEKPAHRVYLDGFYIDKFEVTNAQFAKFLKETDYQSQGNWQKHNNPGKESHPVVNVSWYDAMAYLTWAKKRFPTEAEWEKAARGGLMVKRYPWGDDIDLTKANYANYGEKKGGTTAVGTYAANGYGLFDMAGNVWEWVADFYQETSYQESPYQNPKGPSRGSARVMRGGAWDVGFYALRCASRNWNPPDFWDDCIGFRGARSIN